MPEVTVAPPGIGNRLRARAPVHVHEQGVAARRIEIGGLDHPGVELDTVHLNLQELRLAHPQRLELFPQPGVVLQRAHGLAVRPAQRLHGRHADA